MTCARCGLTAKKPWDRCPSCAAPAGSPPRVPVDCLAKPHPMLPSGVRGEPVALLGAVTLGLFGALTLLSLVGATAQLKAAQAISRGDLDASSVSALRDSVAVLLALVALASFVLWFVWLVRVVRNARAFDLVPQRFTGAWVVGSWFVPLLNIWRPRRIVTDAWRGSGGPETGVITWWWGIAVVAIYPLPFLLALVVGSGRASRGDFQLMGFADLVDAVIWAGSAYLAYRLTALQQKVLAEAAAEADGPPAALGSPTLVAA